MIVIYNDHRNMKSNKSEKEVTQEIQAIIRQITASVTFLPLLNEPCSFDLLVYADNDALVPVLWEDSDPFYIKNAEEVKLRSFTTQVGTLQILLGRARLGYTHSTQSLYLILVVGLI